MTQRWHVHRSSQWNNRNDFLFHRKCKCRACRTELANVMHVFYITTRGLFPRHVPVNFRKHATRGETILVLIARDTCERSTMPRLSIIARDRSTCQHKNFRNKYMDTVTTMIKTYRGSIQLSFSCYSNTTNSFILYLRLFQANRTRWIIAMRSIVETVDVSVTATTTWYKM